ncbi:MAG: homocysteine S-methyltransferase family protein [Rhizobiaceae bacterium]
MRTVVLLDGGMGQELIARSKQPPHPLWSAKVMMDEPETVRAVHEDYLRAGARVLTLNSYSATPERLEAAGLADMFVPLQRAAVDAVKAAIGAVGVDAAVAGCLPPLVASYRPDLALPYERSLDLYHRIVAEQADHVDVFLCETLGSVVEVRAAATAAAESGRPVWMAMTLKDGGDAELRSGEPLADGIAAAIDCGVSAVLANCSFPETISDALDDLAASGLPWGAYANGFTGIEKLQPGGTVKEMEARDDLGPDRYCDWAFETLEHGASITGGCCEVGPAHIAAIARRLEAERFEIAKELHA